MGLTDNCLPEDKLPKCWYDDVRMNALFAPFRLKSANPESWDMKMKFWSEMLNTWCRYKGDPIVSAADAKSAFYRKGRTPACLEIVIEECYKNGTLSPLNKYQQILHNGPEGWLRWSARLAFKPASLVVSAVSFLMPGRELTDNDGLPKARIDCTQRFVLESAVEEQAMNLIQSYPPTVDRIGTIEDLMRNVGRSSSERETFEVLLGYLVSQGLAAKKGDVVKLADTDKKLSPISETDEALVRLLSAEANLVRDSERCALEAAAAANEARAALRTGNKLAAKNHLRRKHKLQERCERSEQALENVRQLLLTMRDMEVNVAVVDTYKRSSEAMKRNMKEGGIDEDSVHETMEDLREVLDTYNEVEKALAGSVDDIDTAELEEELKELMRGGPPSGGTPQKEERRPEREQKTPKKPRQPSEREFVFDGEAQMLAELNRLDIEEHSPRIAKTPVAVADGWESDDVPERKKRWNEPESSYGIKEQLERSLDEMCDGFEELRTDERLHPGQKLQVDYSKPALYKKDFQVQDHTLNERVWLYNSRERQNSEGLACSTEYISSESPGKYGGTFQMAPGGERKKSTEPHTKNELDDLQKRLDNLRGFTAS